MKEKFSKIACVAVISIITLSYVCSIVREVKTISIVNRYEEMAIELQDAIGDPESLERELDQMNQRIDAIESQVDSLSVQTLNR